jgi:hypothetical protein
MTEPNTPIEWRLHDAIKTSLHDAIKDGGSTVDLIAMTGAVYTAVTAFLDDSRPTVAQLRSGPSLTYVHTDNDTMTAVDCAPVRSDPRERAISRALIAEARRLLSGSEQS